MWNAQSHQIWQKSRPVAFNLESDIYVSLKTGHVTASVALKHLVGFSAKNRFYRPNRDLGPILQDRVHSAVLSEPELRRRIRRGLLNLALQELVAEHAEPEQVVSFATLLACGLSKNTPVPGTSHKPAGICDR
jgi:hypothetical protein